MGASRQSLTVRHRLDGGADTIVREEPLVQMPSGFPLEIYLLLFYLVVMRIGTDQAAKIGFQAGPVPLFATDLTLIALVMLSLLKRPEQTIGWFIGGRGAGLIGFAVWLLVVAAVVYFAIAVPHYHVDAARDLAIFSYSIFFPLTWMAIRRRSFAVALLRTFLYAGVALCVLTTIALATGLNLDAILPLGHRFVLGHQVGEIGGGELGGVAAETAAGLLALLIFDRKQIALDVAGFVVSLIALVAATTRSALVGLLGGIAVLFWLAELRKKVLMMGLALLVAFAIVVLMTASPHISRRKGLAAGFIASVESAFQGPQNDPTASFRMLRWYYTGEIWLTHPLLGVGFGRPLLPHIFDPTETEEGKFNGGMPHNTYLFLLARMGLLGFGLVAFCWISGVRQVLKANSRQRDPDALAAAAVLIAMAGFAFFVLFFERPMNNAEFWIILAVALRLSEKKSAASEPGTERGSARDGRLAVALLRAGTTARRNAER